MCFVLAFGAIVMGLSVFTISQSLGTYTRIDGVLSEYGRQVGYAIGMAAVAVAFAVYAELTFASGTIITVAMMVTYLGLVLSSISTMTTGYWIFLVGWGFFLLVGAYISFVAMGIRPIAWYANWVAWGLLYILVILHGIWLILSPEITNSFNADKENIAYAVTGPAVFLFPGLIMAFTFVDAVPLFRGGVRKAVSSSSMSSSSTYRHGYAQAPPPASRHRHGYAYSHQAF